MRCNPRTHQEVEGLQESYQREEDLPASACLVGEVPVTSLQGGDLVEACPEEACPCPLGAEASSARCVTGLTKIASHPGHHCS